MRDSGFQSTQPEWAATKLLPGGKMPEKFQSTQPEWAATDNGAGVDSVRSNFNPRSPSGLRQLYECRFAYRVFISIHAARVGCDQQLAFR